MDCITALTDRVMIVSNISRQYINFVFQDGKKITLKKHDAVLLIGENWDEKTKSW
jgi:hypothetical protein